MLSRCRLEKEEKGVVWTSVVPVKWSCSADAGRASGPFIPGRMEGRRFGPRPSHLAACQGSGPCCSERLKVTALSSEHKASLSALVRAVEEEKTLHTHLRPQKAF